MNIKIYADALSIKILESVRYLYQLAGDIQNVWLIGSVFYIPILTIASYVQSLSLYVILFGNEVQNFYNQVSRGITLPAELTNLISYAGLLIDFIRNPSTIILYTIRYLYPEFITIAADPKGYITTIFNSLIGSALSVLNTLDIKIKNIISSIIPSFSLFQTNPLQWIIGYLHTYSTDISQLLKDPDGYLLGKMRVLFPDLWKIIQDPENYIIEKVVSALEKFLNRYISRLSKIAESILNAIL